MTRTDGGRRRTRRLRLGSAIAGAIAIAACGGTSKPVASTSIATTKPPAATTSAGSAATTSAATTSAGSAATTSAGSAATTSAGSAATTTPPIATTKPPTATSAAALPVGDQPVALDPATMSATIDNPYWPMTPGTRWTYRETGADGEMQAVIVVTDQTKVLANGVTARVVRDTVTQNGKIVEDTIDWFAQDAAGNLWYLGENTAEFDGGKVKGTHGSFEAGAKGALPGIIVPADPQVGMKYRQEYYKGEAEDNGEIESTHESVSIGLGNYTDVLKTKDTSTIEPKLLEHKYYAKGIGVVLTEDASSSRSELVKMDTVPASSANGPLGQPNG